MRTMKPPASAIPTPADVPGFYRELGLELRTGSRVWAPVRCFLADHDDRHASSGINLETGGWRCHGCGGHGGPFHAAVVLGRSRRDAARLVKQHGLWIDTRPNR